MERKLPLFAKFRDYILNTWSKELVLQHIAVMTSTNQGRVCPPPQMWCDLLKERGITVETLVYGFLSQDATLLALWPALIMVMDDNIENLPWTAEVATSIAFFQSISRIPEALFVTLAPINENKN